MTLHSSTANIYKHPSDSFDYNLHREGWLESNNEKYEYVIRVYNPKLKIYS